ncbi:RHS repeat-associated core domain-containing protein [Pseudomonas putida]|nr:RHS repeat-associated core domain-containing protein [Pseudomonas putida]
MSSTLLAVDRLHSPLARFGACNSIAAYLPYGHKPGLIAKPSIGFTGQLCEPAVDWYLLGNGHRAYNSMLMRFHSPDRLSPFGRGGINTYAYCQGDPVNFIDPMGRALTPVQYFILSVVGGGVNLGKTMHAIITWEKKTFLKKAIDGSLSGAGIIASTIAVGASTEALKRAGDNDPAGYGFFSELAKYSFYTASIISGLNFLKMADDVRSAVIVNSTKNQGADQIDGVLLRDPNTSQIPFPPFMGSRNERNWAVLEQTSMTMASNVDELRLDVDVGESIASFD